MSKNKTKPTVVSKITNTLKLTPFKIKLVVLVILLFLSYRYPINSLESQDELTLFILSIFVISHPSPLYSYIKKKLTRPKLAIVLLFIFIIFPALLFLNSKYRDWDNAQLIKGLARDFPVLVEEIEQATGLELEQKIDCSITTEKFSKGVRTCELSVVGSGTEAQLNKAFDIMKNSTNFPITYLFQNKEGYNATYRKKKSCSFRTQERIYSTCITAVREANIGLARELFLDNK